MEEVGTGGADLPVSPGDLAFGFGAVGGSGLAAGEAPLVAGQVPGPPFQVPRVLAPLGSVDGFRVDWQWIPAWGPADITESGRQQLRVIGFTV